MDIKITYETLFEILRREKSREELQKLDENFFSNIVDYLKEKEEFAVKGKSNPDLFSFEDEKKNDNQLLNIKRIIKELYERREKKIINIALNKSKTSSNLIDTSALLPEEKLMFEELIKNLDKYRLGILNNILQNKLPNLKGERLREEGNIVNRGDIEKEETKEDLETEEENNRKVVRFLHPVPKFVGPELEIYGPFEAEEIAALPNEVVRVLVEKKRAEEIKSE